MIVWMVDDVVLCILCVFCVKDYFIKLGYIFGYLWDVFSLNDGVMVGCMNWLNVLYFMYFKNLQVMLFLRCGDWVLFQQKNVQRIFMNLICFFVIDYCFWSVVVDVEYDVDIIFDKKGCGGCFWSLNLYFLGKFSFCIKCVEGDISGLFISFYVFLGEGMII